MVFAQPFYEAHKTCINFENICRENTVLFFEFKRRFLVWIGKDTTGMMLPLTTFIINDQDMALAVQELIRTQGGYTLIADHKVFDTLELPVMGLMSDAGFQYSHRKLERMIRKAHEMGVPDAMAPFITLSFMALPVIPEIRVTPRGIYNVCSGEFYQN